MADIGLKIGLEGEREFKKSLSEINSSFKVLGSEMKLVESQFAKGEKSTASLTAKNQVLEKSITAQKEKISTLEAALKNASESFGTADKRTQAWQVQLNNAKADLNKLEGELKENEDALDGVADEFDDAEKEADEFGDEVKEAGDKSDKASSKMEKIGKVAKAIGVAVAAAAGAVVGFAKSSVEAGATFDSSMSQVAATMGYSVDEINDKTSEAGKTFEQLREYAQQMGSTTVFSASESADALNYMALAGYDAETSMKMLPNVLNLAAAGGIDLASASDMVTDAQSALGLSLDETSLMVDKMAKASSKSNTSVAQLGQAFLTVGGTAKMLRGGTTELSAALGILADNGTKGAEGGTALRNILLSLSAPTDKGAAALERLGVAVSDEEGNMRSLKDVMGDLNTALDGMGDVERSATIKEIFNKADIKNVNAMLATSADRWDELSDAIDGAWYTTDSLNKAYAEVGLSSDTINANLEKLGITSDLVDLSLGTAAGDAKTFAEYLLEGANAGTTYDDVVNALGGDLNTVQDAFNKTSGAAQAMADTQLDNLNGDITLFKSALEGVQIAVSDSLTPTLREFVQFGSSGLSRLTEAFKSNGLDGAMDEFGKILSDGLQMILDMIPQIMSAATSLLMSFVNGIINALPSVIEAAAQVVLTLCDGIGKSLPTLIPTIIEVVVQMVQTLLDNLPLILQAALQLIEGLAEGLLDALPVLIDSLPAIIDGIIDFLVSAIPQIIETGMKLLISLVANLPNIISSIVAVLPQIISSMTTALLKMLPQMIQAGFNILMALIDALPKAISGIVAAMPKIINGIVTALTKNIGTIVNVGLDIFIALIKNLPKAITAIVRALPSVISAIVNGLAKGISSIASVGGNLISGLWNGISNKVSWIVDKIKGFGSSVMNAIKGIFGIHSPSKEMAWVGQMLMRGMSEGIDDNKDEVVSSAKKMSDSVLSAFDNLNEDLTAGITTDFNVSSNIEPYSFPTQSSQPVTISLNIANFNSYGVEDIRQLTNEIMVTANSFMQRKNLAFG